MKFWNYLVIFITMMIFLEFIGVQTGVSSILNNFGISINPSNSYLISADLEKSSFWDKIFGNTGILIAIGIGSAVIIGFLTKSFDTSLVILPVLVTVTGWMIQVFWSITKYAQTTGQQWMIALIATIFVPLGIGFIWSAVQEFRGIA